MLNNPQSSERVFKLWRRHLNLPARPAAITEALTEIEIPAVQVRRLPRFVECRRSDNPLVMIYSAILASLEKLSAAPEALYISSAILPDLRRAAVVAGVSLRNMEYRFFTASAVLNIPIRTENDLPDILRVALAGQIDRDTVIAVAA